MATIQVGNRRVGDGQPVFIIAEIGINHNGDLDIAKKLISLAVGAGCDAVKFQKRTPEICVPRNQWDIPRETPWGLISYIEYKKKIELGEREYRAIDDYCKSSGILWFSSCWDEPSVDFMEQFAPPVYKVASASLTDDGLLQKLKSTGRPVIMSTGASTTDQVDHAVKILGTENLALLHACSAYPADSKDLNLLAIKTLKDRYGVPIGYSGHETGLATSVVPIGLGASIIERHITLDRAMWGTDQAASLGPSGISRLVRDVRLVEAAMGDGVKRVLPSEAAVMKKLRRVG